jgi:phosphohistidine phosphatase
MVAVLQEGFMHLVFVRHAKAQDHAPGLLDEKRMLTPKGRKKTQAIGKGLQVFLKTCTDVRIWASPAERSRQTADIIGEILDCGPAEEHPAIYSGSLEELISLWGHLKENQTLIIVGHEPFLSIWSQQLAGITIPFKKCAAAGFYVGMANIATFRWFADPKALIQLGIEH